jgi:hypothetical protein
VAALRNLNATRWKASSKLHGGPISRVWRAATLEVPTASVPSSWGRHFDGYVKVLGRTSRNASDLTTFTIGDDEAVGNVVFRCFNRVHLHFTRRRCCFPLGRT